MIFDVHNSSDIMPIAKVKAGLFSRCLVGCFGATILELHSREKLNIDRFLLGGQNKGDGWE